MVWRARDEAKATKADYKLFSARRPRRVEKNPWRSSTGFGKHARSDVNEMVGAVVAQNFKTRTYRAAFSLVGSVDEAGDAGLNHRAGAHGAGFDSDVESCAEHAVVADAVSRVTQRQDFRVRRGIAMGNCAVSGARDNFVVDYEHGADGDFSAFGRLAGFLKGLGHEDMIGFGNFRHRAKNSTDANWLRVLDANCYVLPA